MVRDDFFQTNSSIKFVTYALYLKVIVHVDFFQTNNSIKCVTYALYLKVMVHIYFFKTNDSTGLAAADAVSSRNESFWASAEPGIKRDYGENYFRETQVINNSRLLMWA